MPSPSLLRPAEQCLGHLQTAKPAHHTTVADADQKPQDALGPHLEHARSAIIMPLV